MASLEFILIPQVERQATKSLSQGTTWVVWDRYESKLSSPRNGNLDKINQFYRMFLSSLVVKHDDWRPRHGTEKNTWVSFAQLVSTISSIYRNLIHCHKNTEHTTIRFGKFFCKCCSYYSGTTIAKYLL